ncbi:MAG: hypothetical protein ACFFFB_10545, partial [Candidatus Heimdallarchaeota archaeon]
VEELAQEAQKRMVTQPNIPSWTPEELEKFAAERSSGIPEGMEVWTEEELHDLAEKRRGGGLNIPEWAPDEELTECSCGYSLRPGWSKCPICGNPVGEQPSQELQEQPSQELQEQPSQELQEQPLNDSQADSGEEKSELKDEIDEEQTENEEI